MLKCKHLRELHADTHMVQNIKNRTTRHPPIEVKYSNKDLKKIFYISCIDCSSFSKIQRFLSLPMVHIMQSGVAFHTTLLQWHPNTPLQIINKSVTWPSIIHSTPKTINAKDLISLAMVQCNKSSTVSLLH